MLSHRRTFSFFSSFSSSVHKARNPASRLKILPWGPTSLFYVHPLRSSYPSLEVQILILRPKFWPRAPNSSLKAKILALRLKSQPWGWNPGLEAQIPTSRHKSQPRGSNSSLEAQIPALWLSSHYWCSNSKPRSTKLTKHRSSAHSEPLPLSSSHINTYSHRGNEYRWPSDAFATIYFLPSNLKLISIVIIWEELKLFLHFIQKFKINKKKKWNTKGCFNNNSF